MNKFPFLVVFAICLSAQTAPPLVPLKPEPHVFVIQNFHTESGVTLPEARIEYATYGEPDAARDNGVLLPSHYMAGFRGYEWLIGPGRALDQGQLFLVATELFGNGHSSSPSNTPEPFHGPRFPVMTIRDNVEAVHRLLTEELKIDHLRALIGFSMGAQQAFQWAVSYPSFADRIVATSGTAKTYPHGYVRLEGQIAAITTDAAFMGGNYTSPPAKGLSAFGTVWAAWLYSQEWWRRELWRTTSPPGTTFEQVLDRFRTRFIPGGDANDIILQMRTWESHDVGATAGFNGDLERALGSIQVPFLYMPSETDLYFPLEDARYEAPFIKTVTFLPIPSLWGHTAGGASNPADAKFLNENIALFLAGKPVPKAVRLAATSEENSQIVEQGEFRLHKFEQPIGEEVYQIARDPDSLTVKMDFKFTDRGTAVPLTANFRSAQDLTPKAFEIKGDIARGLPIDEAVEILPDKIRVRDRTAWKERAPVKQFFTIAGYAPATMQMLLVRYWATHGKPAELATFPGGTVKIEFRGQDQVRVGGKQESLDRYMIEGLIWGRETLWLDVNRNLVALMTVDGEFDRFEAVREGYEDALGTFVGRAGIDGMAALAEFSRTISGSRAETLALVGGDLIDGTGTGVQPNSTIVIRDGRIVAAGRNVKAPQGAQAIDVHGKTILPGLWDMHAHFEQVEWGPIYLAAGVTTVRDCGNEFEFITAVRDAIGGKRGLGPRLLLAGVVDGTSSYAIGVQRVDTPEQALTWTRRYHQAGFQQMKIYSSVKLEELKVVAAEAHRLGMTVTGHVPEGLSAYQVIEAGQDQINHIGYIADIMYAQPALKTKDVASGWREREKLVIQIDMNSPEAQRAISFLKAHKTVVDPTLALTEMRTATTKKPLSSFEPGSEYVAPEVFTQLADVGPPNEASELREKVLEKQLAIVGALRRAGIPIVAGTDQSVPGHSLHREIELYVQAGFTPMEAIQAATIVPARVMGLDKQLGTVEAGKRADLIVVNGNPLEDIRNTRNVEYVISNGTTYSTADLWRSVGFKPWRTSGVGAHSAR